jgi:hypothetical protein
MRLPFTKTAPTLRLKQVERQDTSSDMARKYSFQSGRFAAFTCTLPVDTSPFFAFPAAAFFIFYSQGNNC